MDQHMESIAVASRTSTPVGQATWQDLWNRGHEKDITVAHVTGHLPMASLGDDEADRLVRVPWVEPALPGEAVGWLLWCLHYAGMKTM